MQERTITVRIVRSAIFTVPEFGTRASFTVDETGRLPVVCAAEGDVAREFIGNYSEGDRVVVRGVYEPRPSTAAANTPWVPRFRACDCAFGRRPPRGIRPYQIEVTRIPGQDMRGFPRLVTEAKSCCGARWLRTLQTRSDHFPLATIAQKRGFQVSEPEATRLPARIEPRAA
jgi:hypothetical protein